MPPELIGLTPLKITMRLGRIDLNAYDVIDSNSLEGDAGRKVDPLFLIPL